MSRVLSRWTKPSPRGGRWAYQNGAWAGRSSQEAVATAGVTRDYVFGALSTAGLASGVPVPAGATSISSGDPSTYFEITSGYLCATAAGAAADLGGDGAAYTLVLNDGSVYNITVEGDTWSCSTQAEWDALMVATATEATFAGKTIRVRALPNGGIYTSGVNGTADKLRRADFSSGGTPLTIRGDDTTITCDDLGDDVDAPTSFPLFDQFVFVGTIGVKLQYLDFAEHTRAKVTMTGTSSFPCGSITIDSCRMRGEVGTPTGDSTYANGVGTGAQQFPNEQHVIAATSVSNYPYQGPFVLTNNFSTWSRRFCNLTSGAGTTTVSGNRIRYFYEDAIRNGYSAADNLLTIEDNVISEPVGKGNDAGMPHCDMIQCAGSSSSVSDWTVKIRRNRGWKGDTRGDYQFILCSDFKSAGVTNGHYFIAEVVGNVFCGQTTIGIQVENAKNCVILNNTLVAETTSPTSNTTIRIGAAGSGEPTTSGTHTLRRNAADFISAGGTPTLDSNVELGAGGATNAYADCFDGDGTSDWSPLTLAELMTRFSRKASGPLDNGGTYDAGAIGSGAVTFSSTVPGNDGSSVNELTPVTGDPIALEVLGASSPTNAGNIIPNGWVAAITFKGLSAGELLDGTKVQLTVTRPGYDSTGAATNRTVTITGTAQLRRPLPQTYAAGLTLAVGDRVISAAKVSGSTRVYQVTAGPGTTVDATGPVNTSGTSTIDGITYQYVGSVNDNSAAINSQAVAYPHKQYLSNTSGSDCIAYAVLDDYVYSTDTITSATVFAGAYDNVSNASLPAIMTITNSSTLAAPKPDIAWVTAPWQLVRSGESIKAEIAVAHPYGQDSRMVAAVKFTVYDNSNVATSVTSTVATMTQSTLLTTTYGNPVPVYAATFTQAALAAAGLADGMYAIRAQVYPFAGTVWDSDSDGFGSTGTWSITTVMPGNNPKRIPFELDSDNSVPIYYAKVDGVGGGTPAVSTNIATARANPYASVSAAATAIQSANSSLKAAVIMIGGSVSLTGFGGSLDSSKTYGTVWLTIRKDPNDSGTASITADTVTSANRIAGKRTKFENLTINAAGTTACIDNAEAAGTANWGHELWLDNCVITGTAGGQNPLSRMGWTMITNSTLTSTGVMVGNTRTAWHLLAGSTMSASLGGSAVCGAVNVLGTKFQSNAQPGLATSRYWNENSQAVASHFYGFNSWYNCTTNVAHAMQCNGSSDGGTTAASLALTVGASWVGNLIESNHANAKGGQLSADGSTIACPRIYYLYNTSAGDGYNLCYNDTGTAQVYPKIGYERCNLSADRNSKGEYFDNVAARGGRTGNLSTRYKVGAKDNFVYGTGSFDLVPSPKNLAGEVFESTSTLSGVAGFTADRSKLGSPTTGNGDYRPTTTSGAKSIIAAADQSLPFDLNGTTRKTDGTGAAGAFEWA